MAVVGAKVFANCAHRIDLPRSGRLPCRVPQEQFLFGPNLRDGATAEARLPWEGRSSHMRPYVRASSYPTPRRPSPAPITETGRCNSHNAIQYRWVSVSSGIRSENGHD